MRYAVHDVVTVCLTSCMNLSDRGESGEMHTAVNSDDERRSCRRVGEESQ